MIKSFLKKILIISLELVLISGALWYVAEKKGIENSSEIIPAIKQTTQRVTENIEKVENLPEKKIQENSFPQLSGEVKRTFNWEYKGVKYSLNETLHQSAYAYYKSQPKSFSYVGDLPTNWEDNYYGMFLKSNTSDQSIAQLANDLVSLGKKHKLSDDQIVELIMSFVQSIKYDDAKAKNILAKKDNITMRYPYEVLFNQLGVCSDKSLLATVILRQLGYGVALFAYEEDNHMAIGIQCSKNSSTYDSGYCFAETTSVGNKIGLIPSFDSESNKTVDAAQLSAFSSAQTQQSNLQQLGQVTVYQKTAGKEYGGLAQTQKIISEIDNLRKEIDSSLPALIKMKKNVGNEESKLKNMNSDLDEFRKNGNIDKYNNLVGEYNNLLETYKKDLEEYNKSVSLYNQTIARYNILIKQ